jgi:serine/threonine protein kinase
VGDFGLSRFLALPGRPMTKEVSTLWYRAPEVLLNNLAYSHPIDIWSVGTIIYEMLNGTKMFKGMSEIE